LRTAKAIAKILFGIKKAAIQVDDGKGGGEHRSGHGSPADVAILARLALPVKEFFHNELEK
jgi:hypothetical protein